MRSSACSCSAHSSEKSDRLLVGHTTSEDHLVPARLCQHPFRCNLQQGGTIPSTLRCLRSGVYCLWQSLPGIAGKPHLLRTWLDFFLQKSGTYCARQPLGSKEQGSKVSLCHDGGRYGERMPNVRAVTMTANGDGFWICS